MQQYLVLAPEVILIVGALVALFADAFGSDRASAIVGAIAATAAAVLVWTFAGAQEMFGGMLVYGDGTASPLMRSVIAGYTAIFLLWVVARGWAGTPSREAVSMTLFVAVGGMLLVAARDLVTLFLALELATIPAYVLVGYARDDRRDLEGTLKYFLLSMLSGLFMAYGLSFVYGITGVTAYAPIDLVSAGKLGYLAILLVLTGFFTKIAAAPFHFWSPDAYEGATVPAVAYVSSVAKVGPIFAMVTFLAAVVPSGASAFASVMLVAAVASMVLGNLVALVQFDIRRMIAYSGIANAGYMMLGVATATPNGYASAVFFSVVYVVGVLGLMLCVAPEGSTLQDVAGLVKRRPLAAWASVGFLFSLIGFPPMAGFNGKLTVFGSALSAGYMWAVVVAILLSVVSAGYAFAIIRAMFTPGEGAPEAVDRPALEETAQVRQMPVFSNVVILVLVVLVLGLGIVTEPVVRLIAAGLV